MTSSGKFTPIPGDLNPALRQILSYWENLRRADNSMPFWDDVNLSALPEAAGRLLLIDAFAAPERFRINTIGQDLAAEQGTSLRGKFIDDFALGGQLRDLRAQASATIAVRAPTFHQGASFSRILLPMWGDGHIGMLLGAVDPH
jgi:hypothetical protein